MCLFPIRAEAQEFGRPKLDKDGSLTLPCGKCYECKSKRAVEWALRARHEIALHDENCFLTLTYDEENLPSYSDPKPEFQKFIKRLRKQLKQKIRYLVSHEFGGKTGRLHHHAIIFGWNPSNQKFLFEAPSGEPLFTSEEVEKHWKLGFHSIGTANEKTAYYIASYSLKSNSHIIIDPDTNTPVKVSDSMDSSRNPAVGRKYFLKHKQQLVNSEESLPRYYQKLLEKFDPQLLEDYQNIQIVKNTKSRSDHQLYAKYVITNQKETESLGTFRNNPSRKFEENMYKRQLKINRDNYVSLTKEEKNGKHNINEKNAYAVKDVKTQLFSSLHFLPSDGVAIRSFSVACENEETELSKFPEDFSLYHLGSFNESTGKLNHVTPKQIANASEFAK